MSQDTDQEYVDVYALGLVALSCCAPQEMSLEEVERRVNALEPTGIESKWSKSAENFRNGEANPHPCEDDPDRLHYLMEC